MNSEFISNRKDGESVKKFVNQLMDKTSGELTEIIARYLLYQPDTVEAALYVSVEKGLISYDLKTRLSQQIDTNFSDHARHIKRYEWEKNNAFIAYISIWSDDEIYNLIEDPTGIIIDVYHAVLVAAKEREFIADVDFNRFYSEAKFAGRTEEEIRNDELNEFFRTESSTDDIPDEAALEAEAEKFWKCPLCNELVGMEFAVCWNCQGISPETIVHPDKEEIVNQIRSEKVITPVKSGIVLIFTSIMIVLLDLARTYSHSHSHIAGFIYGGVVLIMGVIFVIYGLYVKSKTR